jgi:succinate-semialdehyde dehydrogenase/glutarate-semialdehyde dehydrogenase
MSNGIHLVFKAGERFATTNPATGERLADYPIAGVAEVNSAIARARQAQTWWSALPLIRRAAFLRRVARLLNESKQALASVITGESGKPLQEALLNDVLVSADAALFCAEDAASVLHPEDIPHHNLALRLKRARIEWEPLGVIGIIAPWNYPLSIPAADTFAALVTGNTVVLKPSELTPQTALALEQVVNRALDEEGLTTLPRPLQVILGRGPTGGQLVEGDIDKLIFTGSVATGRKVAVACAERLLPVTLELGGKDAMIVLDDADLDVATSAAVWGSMLNAGQTCVSVERCYVQRKLYSKFVSQCVQKIQALKVGPGTDAQTDLGPLITQRQLHIVEQQVDEARALGAIVQLGGRRLTELGENFYAPTLVTDVDHNMSLMCEETFGPVLPITPFDADDDAIRMANDSDFGLAASVWGSPQRAERIARQLQAGTVLVNDLISGFAVAAAPHGGVKHSGLGRTHGRLGLRELVRPRYVDVDQMPSMKKLWWYPYAQNFQPMAAFVDMLHQPGLVARLRASLKTIPLLLRRRR